MRLPPISPHDWAALRSSLRREVVGFGALGALFLGAALVEPYGTERPYSHEPREVTQKDHLSLRERLGYATLLHAGYADVQLERSAPDTATAEQAAAGEVWISTSERSHPDLDCTPNRLRAVTASGVRVDLHRLVRAIVAAERYNRGDLERRMEFAVARLALRIRGRLPEYSLGVGQVRPATARRVLGAQLRGAALADPDLISMLGDECQNVRLAAFHLSDLVAQDTTAADEISAVESVARVYNGADRASRHGLLYVDAVAGAYELLHSGFGSDDDAMIGEAGADTAQADSVASAAANSTRTMLITACRSFEFGELSPSDSAPVEWLPGSEVDSTAKVHLDLTSAEVSIRLKQVETGPPNYLRRLEEIRRGWVLAWLQAQGFDQHRIHVVETMRPRPCSGFSEGRLPGSLVTIDARFTVPVR